ncbi:hypothetical protein A8926_6718 [Saccharopolyspora spinosa]|uniref:Uncharacterized protein n=1 Tax=Saccharopolyspora spinosa TaxID=60894 RepID=A0A2N3Y6X0_SACSN|nr:hypothetical protein A8926_6718 [Saccharopolyspora spinosa]
MRKHARKSDARTQWAVVRSCEFCRSLMAVWLYNHRPVSGSR